MTTITKEIIFEAAHQLPYHDGKCARLHGHSYRAEVDISGDIILPDAILSLSRKRSGGPAKDKNPKMGFVMDFGDISTFLKSLNDQFLDHYYLNETLVDTGYIPRSTAEFISAWIFGMVLRHFSEAVTAVRVYETATSCAEVVYEDYLPLEDGGHVLVLTALKDRNADPARFGSATVAGPKRTYRKRSEPEASKPAVATRTGNLRANHTGRGSSSR